MEAVEMALLLDYYGGMLTQKQRACFDLRYNQDLSLGEIAQELGVSRQAVCDNLTRTEALLQKMEQNVGCVSRGRKARIALERILAAAEELSRHSDEEVCALAQQIRCAAAALEE